MIDLSGTSGVAETERCALILRDLLHQAEKLTGARLADPNFVCELEDPHRLKDPQRAQRITVGDVFGALKTHRQMALGAEVVNLIGLHLLDDPDQVGAVG